MVRYLSSDECRRLVNRCPEDLRQMVRAAILTGCRYGELSRLRCEDVNLDAHTVAIRQSKGGKPRHVVLTGEGIAFFNSLVAGRKPRDLLLQRKDGGVWKAAQQTRPLKEACAEAKITPAVGFLASYPALPIEITLVSPAIPRSGKAPRIVSAT